MDDDLAFALAAQDEMERAAASQIPPSGSQGGSQDFGSPSASQQSQQRPEGDAPCCPCGPPMKCFQVKKDSQNKGRWFYKCSMEQCKKFVWADNRPNLNSPYKQRFPGQGQTLGGASPQMMSPMQPPLSQHTPQHASQPSQPATPTHTWPSSSLPVARALPFSIHPQGGPGASMQGMHAQGVQGASMQGMHAPGAQSMGMGAGAGVAQSPSTHFPNQMPSFGVMGSPPSSQQQPLQQQQQQQQPQQPQQQWQPQQMVGQQPRPGQPVFTIRPPAAGMRGTPPHQQQQYSQGFALNVSSAPSVGFSSPQQASLAGFQQQQQLRQQWQQQQGIGMMQAGGMMQGSGMMQPGMTMSSTPQQQGMGDMMMMSPQQQLGQQGVGGMGMGAGWQGGGLSQGSGMGMGMGMGSQSSPGSSQMSPNMAGGQSMGWGMGMAAQSSPGMAAQMLPGTQQQQALFMQQAAEQLEPRPCTSPEGPMRPQKGIVVQLDLDGPGRFSARSKYHPDFPATIKTTDRSLTDYKWDPQRKCWSFSMEGYAEVVKTLKQAGFTVEELSDGVTDGCEQLCAQYRLPDEQITQRVPEVLWERLLPFQREGVRFILSVQGRALLADEMGLGKSVQALAAAAAFYPQDWPLLIICPSSLRFMWAESVRQWLPANMQPTDSDLWVISSSQDISKLLSTTRGPPRSANKPHVCITSYDLVQKMEGMEKAYQFIIADESHALKNPEAKRTKFVQSLVQAARRAVLITGTPVLSRPIEIWPQVDMLRPGFLGTYHEFGKRYCLSPWAESSPSSPFGPDYRGSRHPAELNQRLTACVMIRRQKDDVLSQLPDKIKQEIPIQAENITQELRDLRNQFQRSPMKEPRSAREERGLQEIAEAMGVAQENEARKREKNEQLTAYWRASGPAKIKGGLAFLSDLLERGDIKVLVFAHHQVVLDAYANELSKMKVGFVRIDGSCNDAQRKAAVDAFQTQKSTRVALLSITAAAVGITLNAAEAIVFAELHWTPSLMVQAEDRAHRIGQKNAIMCYYLVAKGTADDIMWPTLKNKQQVISEVIDGSEGSDTPAKRQRTGGEGGAHSSGGASSSTVPLVVIDDD